MTERAISGGGLVFGPIGGASELLGAHVCLLGELQAVFVIVAGRISDGGITIAATQVRLASLGPVDEICARRVDILVSS